MFVACGRRAPVIRARSGNMTDRRRFATASLYITVRAKDIAKNLSICQSNRLAASGGDTNHGATQSIERCNAQRCTANGYKASQSGFSNTWCVASQIGIKLYSNDRTTSLSLHEAEMVERW